MRRLPTNLTKLSDAEQRLKEEADALARKRAALVRQRERLEKHAQTERYIAVGKLVEHLGLPIADLEALEQVLKTLGQDNPSLLPNQTMSTTSLRMCHFEDFRNWMRLGSALHDK